MLPTFPYMVKWEGLIGHPISPRQWRHIWEAASRSSICTVYRENQYKILYMWYHTPEFLHARFQSVSPLCWRCGSDVGSTYHIFWTCPRITPYWRIVRKLIKEVTHRNLPLKPIHFLLGLPYMRKPKNLRKFISHILTAARCLISTRWKNPLPPSIRDFVQRITDVKYIEYLTARFNNSVPQFEGIWAPWSSHFDSTVVN